MIALAAISAAIAGPFGGGGGPFVAQQGAQLTGQTLGSYVPATSADPSSILQSVTAEGSHLRIVLEDATTVSDTPDEFASWSLPARDAFGTLHEVEPTDAVLLRLWLGDNGLPADVICAATLTDGAMSATTEGIGVSLQAGTSGATIVGNPIGSGTSWTTTAGTAGSTSTYGAELGLGMITNATGQSQRGVRPIDAAGDMVVLTNGSPAAAGSNGVLGPFDTLSVGCGWRTGSGGTNGAVVTVSADLVVVPAARVPTAARSAISRSSRLPLYNGGAIPSELVILGGWNSHMQGAASGPIDTDFTGLAVQAGCTYRQNNAAVTTWGDRQGSVPYLCEELLAAGVTTVNIAVNASSGRTAQVMIDNMGNAARDVFALGTPAAPARPDAIVWLGVPIGAIADQAGYDEFLVDFPAVLDLAAYHFPGVPIFVHAGIAASDTDGGPFWDEVRAAQQSLCAAHAGCVYFGTELDASDLDGTDHPTVGYGEGTDILADQIMTALGFP